MKIEPIQFADTRVLHKLLDRMIRYRARGQRISHSELCKSATRHPIMDDTWQFTSAHWNSFQYDKALRHIEYELILRHEHCWDEHYPTGFKWLDSEKDIQGGYHGEA